MYANPSFSTQPVAQSATQGGTVSFSVVAEGSGALSIQWRKDGVGISGATSATYTIAAVDFADAGSYSAVVTNAFGSSISTTAALTVNAAVAPKITFQPIPETVPVGGGVSFTVTATGTAPLRYQWSKDGTPITGAT
jgi:hypothetical protein